MSAASDGQERLTATELAARADTSLDRIDQLVAIGALTPDAEGLFGAADVQRISIVAAYEAGGIGIDLLATALREGNMTFAYSDRIYPRPGSWTGRTIEQLAAACGTTPQRMRDLFLAFNLPQPQPGDPVSIADEEALGAFIAAWDAEELAADAGVRAARIAGSTARRLVDGWIDLFLEAVSMQPMERLRRSIDELGPGFFQPAARVAGAAEPVTSWLLRRHLENGLNRANIEFMEFAMETTGLRPVGTKMPAVTFADMTDFTVLTERLGDRIAAANATRLGDLALKVAAEHGGRLVKQLGDGVMLKFERVPDGVAAMRALAEAAAAGGDLPPLHIGMAAGPVIERDADLYGRTVNMAARISGVAGAGEILLNDVAAAGVPETTLEWLGDVELKGFAAPVRLARVLSV